MQAFQKNLLYFYNPTQVLAGEAPAGSVFRVGGMVERGSVRRASGSLEVRFTLTDYAERVVVSYTGVLPDLFREGQGIIARGRLGPDGTFVAEEVLAKHDENYMPPEVKESLQPHVEAAQPAAADAHGRQLTAPEPMMGRRTRTFRADPGAAALDCAGGLRARRARRVGSSRGWRPPARPSPANGCSSPWRSPCWPGRSISNDFSVLYVAQNSNSALPAFYRFAAVWGAHEGSLLLWALALASWSLAVAAFSRQLPESFAARVLGVLGRRQRRVFPLFILVTSNPFERLMPAAPDGRDLNPLLQDFALAVHPPMLYVGYVGFSVAFAFAVAALLEGRLDARWARWTRPWTTLAWLLSHGRHRARQLVGVLRTGLGWLVVLGSRSRMPRSCRGSSAPR